MGWVAGKKSGETLVEVLLRRPEWTLAQLQNVIPINYGGVSGDYSFHQMSANDEVRVRNGDEYSVVWTANEISSVSFAPEDAKRYVKIYADALEIDGDGVDTSNITLEVWKTDLSGIDTAVTVSNKSIPIQTPDGERWARVSVTNGVATKAFKTTKAGEWQFPARRRRFRDVRVLDPILVINVRDTSVWD